MNSLIFIYPYQALLITLPLSYMRAQQSVVSGRLFSLFSKILGSISLFLRLPSLN